MAEHRTHIDELVDYPGLVVGQLVKQPNMLELLANKKNANYEDLENDKGEWKCFFDYDYVNGTLQEVGSYICIDTDVVDVPNSSVMTLKLYVEIIVHRDIMTISRQLLPGYKGNRRDELTRYCDLALRGSRDFGIGRLSLQSAVTFSVGNSNYTGKRLTYLVKGYATDRGKLP